MPVDPTASMDGDALREMLKLELESNAKIAALTLRVETLETASGVPVSGAASAPIKQQLFYENNEEVEYTRTKPPIPTP